MNPRQLAPLLLHGSLLLAASGCKSKPPAGAAPSASAPPVATAAPSASASAKKVFPPMNPGSKVLARGKRLGEHTNDDVAAVLEKAGWNVFSSSTTRSSEHVVIITVAARKSEVQTVAVHVYRYEDPDWRASRIKVLEGEANRVTFKDGDFVLQVGARTNEQPDPKVNADVLAAIVGG